MIDILDVQTFATTATLPRYSGTAWANTGCAVAITPKSVTSKIRIDYSGPAFQSGSQIIPLLTILRGGMPIGAPMSGWSVGTSLNVFPFAGHTFDAPETTQEVVYTVGMRNSDPGGGIDFPATFFGGGARITATEIEDCGGVPPQSRVPVDSVAFSGGVVSQLMQYDPGDRVEVSPSITGRTLVKFILGQSMTINEGPTPYTPANASVHQLDPYTGKALKAKDPLIGCWTINGGHNWNTREADQLVTDGAFERVILVPLAVGSSKVEDWGPSGTLNQRLVCAALWAKHFGWHQNPDVSMIVGWDQGHANSTTPAAAYQAEFNQVRNTLIGLGLDLPWFIALTSYANGVISSTLPIAEAALIDNVKVFQGPNCDQFGAGYRLADTVHKNDAGIIAKANLGASIMLAHFSP